MASFSCPHLLMENDYCRRLKTDCVPGRPGCILPDDTHFDVSWEKRLEKRTKQKEQSDGGGSSHLPEFFRD